MSTLTLADEIDRCFKDLHLATKFWWKVPRHQNGFETQAHRYARWAANLDKQRKIARERYPSRVDHIDRTVRSLLEGLRDNLQRALEVLTGPQTPHNRLDVPHENEIATQSEHYRLENRPWRDRLSPIEIKELEKEVTRKVDYLVELAAQLRGMPQPKDSPKKVFRVESSEENDFDNFLQGCDPRNDLRNRIWTANDRRRKKFRNLWLDNLKYILQREWASEPQQHWDSPQSSLPRTNDSGMRVGGNNVCETYRSGLQDGTIMCDADLTVSLHQHHSDALGTLEKTISQEKQSPKNTHDEHLGHVSFPLMPAERLDTNNLQCPFCYEYVVLSGENSWRDHIVHDLQPYICVFGECPSSSDMFPSYRDWMAHELDAHGQDMQQSTALFSIFTHRLPSASKVALPSGEEAAPRVHDYIHMDGSNYVIPSGKNRSVPVEMQRTNVCPICASSVEDVSQFNHLAEHFLATAMLSLPRPMYAWADGYAPTRPFKANAEVLSQLASQSAKSLLAAMSSTIYAAGDEQRSALSRDAEAGNTGDVEYLLKFRHTDINERDSLSSRTALHWAVEKGHLEVVERLLMRPDIKLNERDIQGQSPIWIASFIGSVEIVRLLVACPGVDLNSSDSSGRTPLSCASAEDHAAVVEILIAYGARPHLVDKDKRTALAIAASRGSLNAISVLLGYPYLPIDVRDENGRTALMIAAEHDHIRVVELLHRAGSNVDACDKFSQSALFQAIGSTSRNAFEVASFLIDMGSLHQIQATQDDLLEKAAKLNKPEIFDQLLEKGAEIPGNNKFSEGKVLIAAAEGGNVQLVKKVLALGVDANASNLDRKTAVDTAARYGHLDILTTLIDHGAKIQGRRGILVEAAKGDHDDVVDMLIKSGLDINAQDASGMNALMTAAEKGFLSLVQSLLGNKTVQIDAVGSKDSRTALHLAAEHGHEEVARLLLEQGADPTKRDHQKITPAQLATRRGHEALCMLILRHERMAGQNTSHTEAPK